LHSVALKLRRLYHMVSNLISFNNSGARCGNTVPAGRGGQRGEAAGVSSCCPHSLVVRRFVDVNWNIAVFNPVKEQEG
jgi:hypothetical protein